MNVKPRYMVTVFDAHGQRIDGFEVGGVNLRVAAETAIARMGSRDSGHGQTATKLVIEAYGTVTK